MSSNSNLSPRPKPPHDFFPWLYWIPFFIVVPIIAVSMANSPMLVQPRTSQINVPLLNREVPAYHIITANDLYLGVVDSNFVGTRIIRDAQELIGHYTITSILADKPILGDQIGPKPESRLITNTLAVAIPATSTTLLGGNLHAGDIVSIASMPLSNATALPRIVFDSVLVLDVKQSPQNQAIIILAIPTFRWPSFLAEMQNATVVLALREG